MLAPTRSDAIFLACALIVASLLLFTRLDDSFLWQDEAETALLARSVLSHGVPTAYDGRNWISQEGQQEFSPPDYRWSWTPWLQHYAAAASFAILGVGTFSARLPFVLFGIGCVYLCFRLGMEVSRDRRVARVAVLVLLASVPFLLHVRQCRYYAPLCFFATLLLLQYLRVLAGRRYAHWGLAVAAAGLFHSHYVAFAGLVAGLGLHYVLLSRDRQCLARLAIACAATLLLTAPFAARFAATTTGQAFPGFDRSLSSLQDAVFHLNRYVLPFGLLLILAGTLAGDRRAQGGGDEGTWRRALPIVFAVASCVAALVVVMPWFFFRHYVALIPLCAVLQALVVMRLWRWQWLAGAALLVLLLGTDLLPRAFPMQQRIPRGSVRHLRTGDEEPARVVGPWARFVPLSAFLYEITHERTGPIEAAVRHLDLHAKPGETLIATYGDLPLQFYTDLKVVGGLSGEDVTPHLDAEWVLWRAHTHRSGDQRLKQRIARELDLARYSVTSLGVLDTPFENRPDPTYHKFRSPTAGLPELQIWHREEAPAADADRDGEPARARRRE